MDRQAQKLVLGVVLLLVATAGLKALVLRLGDGGPESVAPAGTRRFPAAPLSGLVDGVGSGPPGAVLDDPPTLPSSSTTTRPSPTTITALPTTAPPGPSIPPTTPTTLPTTIGPASTTSTIAAVDEVPVPDTTASGEPVPPPPPSPTASIIAQQAPPPSTTTTVPAAAAGAGAAPLPTGSLSVVEEEIARLTNELRTDPNGPLRRTGAFLDCGGRVPVDAEGRRYLPVAPVVVDEPASRLVARPWAARLTTQLHHRPRAGVTALEEAGIPVWTAGENVAYHNYPDTAFRHFVGWRESDGHFCNLMDPEFTHLGVGEVTRADGVSYAAQNFFSLH